LGVGNPSAKAIRECALLGGARILGAWLPRRDHVSLAANDYETQVDAGVGGEDGAAMGLL
jgi:hypothetical protein